MKMLVARRSPLMNVGAYLVAVCRLQEQVGLLTNSEVLQVLKERGCDTNDPSSRALPSEREVTEVEQRGPSTQPTTVYVAGVRLLGGALLWAAAGWQVPAVPRRPSGTMSPSPIDTA